jgi:gamma-tubulin complex component 5
LCAAINFPICYYYASNNFIFIVFSLCAGAEHLCQIIYEAVPDVFFDSGTAMITMLSSEVAVHILNHLFNKLSNVCLVQGGEVVKKKTLFVLFYLL